MKSKNRKARKNDLVSKYNELANKDNKLLISAKSIIKENKIFKDEKNSLSKEILVLKEVKEDITHRFVNSIKAMGMLKYDKDGKYGIENLTDDQSRLFDAVSNYAKDYLKSKNEEELLKEVTKKVGFSKGIENQIKALEPKVKIKTRELGR